MMTNKNTIPDISVVVLAYRSEEAIEGFVESLVSSLEERGLFWELILVGNYLSEKGDRTPEVVKRIAKQSPRIKAVVKEKQGMMGWDMRSGLQEATGKTLAVIDGDGQMPYADVVRVYDLMMEKGLDFVKTARIQRNDGPYRKLISVVFNALFKILFPGINGWDMNSKPKIMSRDLYEKMNLESNGWFIDAEIMLMVRRFKAKTGEVETVFHGIYHRASFVKPLSIFEFVGNLIWYRIKEFKE
jgi:glycosyltransferase involved in cell wall biosynthesis